MAKSLIGMLTPFDPSDNIDIADFLNHFDQLSTLKGLSENDKNIQLGCLLKNNAYTIYLKHILPNNLSYEEAKQKLIDFLTIKKSDPFSDFVNLQLGTLNIQTYFHKKTELATRLNLNTEHILSALTQGVPLKYKKIIGPQLPNDLAKWLKIGLFCEDMFKNEQTTNNTPIQKPNNSYFRQNNTFNGPDRRSAAPQQNMRPPHSQRFPAPIRPRSDLRSNSTNFQRPQNGTRYAGPPPTPCPKCLSFGRQNYHWLRDCYANYGRNTNTTPPTINNSNSPRVHYMENTDNDQLDSSYYTDDPEPKN